MEVLPNDRDFLAWFRRKTEFAWRQHSPRTLADYKARHVGGSDWQTGTRWSGGLSDSQIRGAEVKWDIRFPPDYRAFLLELGATDRLMQGARFSEGGSLSPVETVGFYDWRTDDAAIRSAMAWPTAGLLFDVERNDLWLDSWGHRPDSQQGRESTVRVLVEDAPRLIPVYGHRYLLGEPCEMGNPVLSVYQSDVIIYGRELHTYLMMEMVTMLGLDRQRVQEEADRGVTLEYVRSIPFWGEILAMGFGS